MLHNIVKTILIIEKIRLRKKLEQIQFIIFPALLEFRVPNLAPFDHPS